MSNLQTVIVSLQDDVHKLDQLLFKVQMIAGIVMTVQAICIGYLVMNCA